MYSKVVQNIVNGHCPHVKHVSHEYVKETSVYGVHIVTAVGNLNALDEIGIINSGIYGGLYDLDPYCVA